MNEQLVYPVYSRRSEGISIGIDLFPDAKHCSFNCPYCEVHPFHHERSFSLEELKRELERVLSVYSSSAEPVNDIAFAGHGEPLLSPHFMDAVTSVLAIKNRYMPELPIVVITNALDLGKSHIINFLQTIRSKTPFAVWAKLDAGTPDQFYRMCGLKPDSNAFETVQNSILTAGKLIPLVIQTMLARYQGLPPTLHELIAYAELIRTMVDSGVFIERIDFYTISRKPLTPLVSPLTDRELSDAVHSIVDRLHGIPIRAFGKTTRIL